MDVKYINRTQDIPLKVFLVFLILLIIVGLILLFVSDKQYKDCKNEESPLCLTGNCPANSSICKNIPFKIESGQTICKSSILNQPSNPLVNFSNSA